MAARTSASIRIISRAVRLASFSSAFSARATARRPSRRRLSGEVAKIRGLKSRQIAQVLGHHPYDEVIHRDNLTITVEMDD